MHNGMHQGQGSTVPYDYSHCLFLPQGLPREPLRGLSRDVRSRRVAAERVLPARGGAADDTGVDEWGPWRCALTAGR